MTVPAPLAQLLHADRVSFARGGRQVLDDVSITIAPGELVAVTGPSGSGKSSLLALLAGLERPDTGAVSLGDRPLARYDDPTRPPFGLVLQGYGLVSVLTAAENVEIVIQARGLPPAVVAERALGALDDVGLADHVDHLVEELSGGQQQRVALARALVTEPVVLLADEPTAELDAASRDAVLALFRERARRGAAVAIATHDREVAGACDREVRLVNGQLAQG